jgi:hypothetical protein
MALRREKCNHLREKDVGTKWCKYNVYASLTAKDSYVPFQGNLVTGHPQNRKI